MVCGCGCSNEQGQVGNLARKIAREHLALRAAQTDRDRAFPWEAISVMGQAQLPAVAVESVAGGLGAGRLGFTAVVEELARACASTALIFVSHVVALKAVEIAAGEEIKARLLPLLVRMEKLGAFAVHEPDSGCNHAALTTRARREGEGYLLNGSKIFITSAGEADFYLVMARTGEGQGAQGLTALLVSKDAPGLSFDRIEDKMGLRGTSSRTIHFSDCQVPAANLLGVEGQGMQIMAGSIAGWGIFGAAAIAMGIAREATEAALRHARERVIAGTPIGDHQAVQSLISNMVLGTEAATALLARCAAKADASAGPALVEAFKAKLFATETALEVTDQAIQVLGGHGYCRDYVVERLYRDARGLTLHFKTSELLRQDIAKAALGL